MKTSINRGLTLTELTMSTKQIYVYIKEIILKKIIKLNFFSPEYSPILVEIFELCMTYTMLDPFFLL